MNIVVIGHGGHSKVICDLILSNQENEIVGFLDDKYEKVEIIDHTLYGPIRDAEEIIDLFTDIKFVIAIGNNKVRHEIVERLKIPNDYYATIIHKSAVVSPSAKIGNGTVIMPNSVVNANTEIGLHCIMNTGSVIEHDCKIGNYVHVCPNSTLTGTVHLENCAFVGAGATIIPNIKIGEGAIIGAGAAVIHHIAPHNNAVGVPARIYKVNEREGEAIAGVNN